MRCNVDLLKIIQVGLTLADEEGNFPQEVSTWQFNFRFSAEYVYLSNCPPSPSPLVQRCKYAPLSCLHKPISREDMYAPESLDLLQNSGIELQRHHEMGIEPNDFAELMITSGLVLSPDTKWISFHR